MIAIEPQSPTWRALRRHIEARITDIHLELEQPLEPDHTAMLRGRITELRALIATVEPPARATPDTEIGAPVY